MTERYRLVFSGKIIKGYDSDVVRQKIASLFNLDAEKTDELSAGEPMIIMEDIDYQTAQNYIIDFKTDGALLDMEQIHTVAGQELGQLADAAEPKKMVCPKCELEQEKADECVRCGIAINKFLKKTEIPSSGPNEYYSLSGKIGLMGPIFMLLFGGIGTACLSIIYGYAIFYSPFIYLNMCLTILFGAAIGAMVGLGGKWGKVRNLSVYFLAGLLFGLLAEYAGGWIFWIHALSKQKFLLVHPQDVLNVATEIAATGAWSMFGWTPRGISLYLIWGIEALIIVGCATFISRSMVASTPFCERCNRWIKEKKSIHPLQIITDQNKFRNHLEKGDYTMVNALQKIERTSRSYTQL